MTGFIIGIILLIIFLPLLVAGLSGAPWVPVKKRDIERINKLANLKPGQKFIELGSGDGRVSHYIAENNPEVEIVGVEISWPVFLMSKVRTLFNPLNNYKLILGDAYKQNIKDADVIFFYFLPRTMESRLKKKLLQEMKPGAKAISYVFGFKRWPGKHIVDKSSAHPYPIHIYLR